MKLHKINWYPLAALVVGLAAFAFSVSAAFAEVISEHDRQDMALKMAMVDCKAQGGDINTLNWKQQTRWRLDRVPGGYHIIGNALFVTCEIPQASGPSRWLLTWKAPTTKIDCTPLPADQIAGYLIRSDGSTLAMVPGTEYLTEPMESIEHLTIATVDKDGLESEQIKFGDSADSQCQSS